MASNVGVMPGRWDTSRTEAFSDGVFAIAITLLVLDLAVPESELNDLWSGIGHQWPGYLAYATSFITIGGIWTGIESLARDLIRLRRGAGDYVTTACRFWARGLADA